MRYNDIRFLRNNIVISIVFHVFKGAARNMRMKDVKIIRTSAEEKMYHRKRESRTVGQQRTEIKRIEQCR